DAQRKSFTRAVKRAITDGPFGRAEGYQCKGHALVHPRGSPMNSVQFCPHSVRSDFRAWTKLDKITLGVILSAILSKGANLLGLELCPILSGFCPLIKNGEAQ